MTIFRHEIPLKIMLRSPFVTRGLAPDRATIDTPLARDALGRIMLPGTLVQGVIRAALGELCFHLESDVLEGGRMPLRNEISALFGEASDGEARGERSADGWQVENTPRRGRLSFSDLIVEGSDGPSAANQVLTRIQIDPGLGSVREGFLQTIELPYQQGEIVAFEGTAHLRAGGLDVDRASLLIERALALVPAIGAIKSAGFGKVADFKVEKPIPIQIAIPETCEVDEPLAFRYKIDRPFLVGSSRASGNLFRGDDVIPGAGIKGVLAESLSDAGCMDTSMSDWLAKLTVSHAFPRKLGEGGLASLPLPRTLAVAKSIERADPKVIDQLLGVDETGEINGETDTLAFCVDWKSEDKQLVAGAVDQGSPLPSRDVRTRTKIDPKTGTSAFEQLDGETEPAGQLFSYSAVCAHEHEWHGWLTPPKGTDAKQLVIVLGLLNAGVVGFGKTSSVLSGEIAGDGHALPPQNANTLAENDRRYAVTLLSPALLNDLEALRSGVELFDDYKAYWRARGFELRDFFAAQRVEGGYVALRYPQRSDCYEPYLVTEPGSVFLIEPENDADLGPLLTSGLPPNDAITRRDWRSCPYLAENGFGMICCNRIDHVGLSKGIGRVAS